MNSTSRSNLIAKLKRRRDRLLSRACTRFERPDILKEVRTINRKIWQLEGLRHSE